jgi:hypothetical protein
MSKFLKAVNFSVVSHFEVGLCKYAILDVDYRVRSLFNLFGLLVHLVPGKFVTKRELLYMDGDGFLRRTRTGEILNKRKGATDVNFLGAYDAVTNLVLHIDELTDEDKSLLNEIGYMV